ncbi:MAG TPA: aminotransferase class I/II-fold pyridoxal phosphate-dependent enzyme [Kofleriaceae bacterium]|nr:aminotransferase class I/II-fold pyridoxal phosphate-dependent enzyme [Kofleriaceae bacterium]
MSRIGLSEPFLGGNERAYISECIDTNFVSSVGPFVERFEREFAAYVGAKHAVACASGTAALHVAFRLIGLSPGDEVLVPSLTFVASVNPITYERGTPVLVDSELESWNMDPDLVVDYIERAARAGKELPKAVEVVHLLGHPAKLEAIVDVCGKHGIAVIEDAAEALGARYRGGRYDGKHVGTIGRIGCFSFNGNKIMTTGGGGMLTTDDAELARRAKHLTTQARLPGPAYRHDEIGYNYRLTNVAAAMGVAQLEQLPSFIAKKLAIASRYDAALAGRDGFVPPPRASWASPTCWLYSLRVARGRDEQMQKLAAAQIESRPIWTPVHTMPMYATAPRIGGANAEQLAAEGLSIPCSVGLSDEQQDRVISLLS